MNRRDMMTRTGGAIAMAGAGSVDDAVGRGNASVHVSEPMKSTMRVVSDRITIETPILTAVIEKGWFTSLRNKATGEEYIEGANTSAAALQLVYADGAAVNVNEEKFGVIVTRSLSDTKAEIVFHSWDGDGVVTISVDPVTGDIVVEPSAYSSRPGVRACRWNIGGIRKDLRLVAPFFQGVNLALDDVLIRNTRREWPMWWEAGLAILQSGKGGFWVHAEDTRFRFKSLKVGSSSYPYILGFDSESYGPIDANLGAGGISWRVNVHSGPWTNPVESYRQWYWKAWGLESRENLRRQWIHEVRFAVCWCPPNPGILDALAKKLKPSRVLIHFPDWRIDNYDENYPSYVASENGKAFIAKARTMGFRIMPHFNAIDMDPSHPAYTLIRDFQYRSLETKQLLGWSWYKNRGIGVPESNNSLFGNRDKKVMVKVHPGLGMWRSILGENILAAVRDLNLETVFTDVTLHCINYHNSLVDATTSSEGMLKIIDHVASLDKGLAVGGEGLNEITAQGLSFAQAHLFNGWEPNVAGLERTGGCDLNERLFGRLCRTIGYSGLSGNTANEELRMRIHIEHGAIPTVTIGSETDIINPNPAVKRMLDIALGT
jgi:hypothetical protein